MKKLLLLSIFILLINCVSFKSVTSTGKLAQKIENNQSLYIDSITICDYLKSMDDQVINSNYCKSFSTNLKNTKESLTVLIDYGKALEKIAEDSKFETDDKIDLIIKGGEGANWLKLDDDTQKGIKSIASSITKLVTNSVKRRNLKKIIIETNQPIQNVIDSILVPELENRLIAYNILSKQINNVFNQSELKKPDMRRIYNSELGEISESQFVVYNDLDILNMVRFQNFIELKLGNIAGTKKVLEAFSKSHQKLYDEIEKVGTKNDIEVTKEIIEIIKSIYKEVEKI